MGLTESTYGTLEHIREVQRGLAAFAATLIERGIVHDRTKLEDPEHEHFEVATPRLKGLTYGSEEYKESLRSIKPAIEHHNAHNSHHPEHYAEGILGFDLFDLVEMFCDWQAAVKRHADGDLRRSVTLNQERFGYSDDLRSILMNTMTKRLKKPKKTVGYGYSSSWIEGGGDNEVGRTLPKMIGGGWATRRSPMDLEDEGLAVLSDGEATYLCKITIEPVLDKLGLPITKRVKKEQGR